MKRYLQTKHVCLLLIWVFLTGCSTVSPNRLGISESDWEQYSPAKKDQLILAYEQTQQHKKTVHASAGSGVLFVRIQDGEALLPPYMSLTAYTPVTFKVRQGDCHKKIAIHPDNTDAEAGKLEVCYKDDTLYLDPSPYDPNLSLGALRFPYMPIWKRGFTYPSVTSTGLLKLTGVHIYLHQVVPSDDD